jgi:hypothetical protein
MHPGPADAGLNEDHPNAALATPHHNATSAATLIDYSNVELPRKLQLVPDVDPGAGIRQVFDDAGAPFTDVDMRRQARKSRGSTTALPAAPIR